MILVMAADYRPRVLESGSEEAKEIAESVQERGPLVE
jgi:hypothetical protein